MFKQKYLGQYGLQMIIKDQTQVNSNVKSTKMKFGLTNRTEVNTSKVKTPPWKKFGKAEVS